MLRNIERFDGALSVLQVAARPHLKTAKSLDVARRVLKAHGAATVSTLREADMLAAAGLSDLLYAVGIAPQKLARVVALRAAGCDLTIVLDSLPQAEAVIAACRTAQDAIPVLIEIDCDGHRSGLDPNDPTLVTIGRRLVSGGVDLRGVMTHAGESYSARSTAELVECAERERRAVVAAAAVLAAAGCPCRIVSVGSTPTARFARDWTGVTEVRAGVYVFFDLVMAGLGVCGLDDIALSVLATVIGHQTQRGWVLVDAGWMALSRDRGTAQQPVDQGYGVVCNTDGTVIDDLIVTQVHQEHGVVARRPGSRAPLPDLPVGTMLRILPNHACATAAQFDGYAAIRDGLGTIEHWPRFRGW